MKAADVLDLWTLTRKQPEIDPRDLASAVQREAAPGDLDYRTRLLIRDSLEALRQYWGRERLESWLAACPVRKQIEIIATEPFEETGFPSLRSRLMEKTDPEDIRAYLRAVGSHLHRSAKICIGGSAALLLTGYLSRYMEYINVVDEVPEEIRQAHTTQRWQQELPLKENAQRNWYILFGEENLPQ